MTANSPASSVAGCDCTLERIGAAEAGAAQNYRTSVEAQRQADATPIPKLSERAEAAVTALAAATDERAQVALWRGMTSDKTIGAELRQFSAAVQANGRKGGRPRKTSRTKAA